MSILDIFILTLSKAFTIQLQALGLGAVAFGCHGLCIFLVKGSRGGFLVGRGIYGREDSVEELLGSEGVTGVIVRATVLWNLNNRYFDRSEGFC